MMKKFLIRGGLALIIANEIGGVVMVAMIGPGLVKAVWSAFAG